MRRPRLAVPTAVLGAVLTLALFVAGGPPAAAADPPSARSEEGGQTVLVLRGTHRERGEALGRLAGREVLALVRDYGLRLIPPEQLATVRAGYRMAFTLPAWFEEEAAGVLAGMQAAGVSLRLDPVGRDVDPLDLAIFATVPDLDGMACSSVSAWGRRTRQAPGLAGAPILARNLDYSLPDGAEEAVRGAAALVVHLPSEPDEQPWVSVGMMGFLGALSGMDASGRGAFLNLDVEAEKLPFHRLFFRGSMPTALALREGLERRDVDGDGRTRLADLEAAMRAHPRLGAVLVHAVSGATDEVPPAFTMEMSADAFDVRRPAEGEDALYLTNHSIARAPKTSCTRVRRLAKHLARARADLGAEVLSGWLDDVAFRGELRTLESMVFEPRARRLGVAFTRGTGSATDVPLVWHDLARLLAR